MNRTNLEYFHYWQQERENIRIKREQLKLPPPWTSDHILRTYRFCNLRREDDRVTRWIKLHIREKYAGQHTLPLMLGIARWINSPETLAWLQKTEGWPSPTSWDAEKFYNLIRQRAKKNKVYGAAYVISPGGTKDKHLYVTKILNILYDKLDIFYRHTDTMENAFNYLNQFAGWGNFMTFQTIVDIRHTPILENAPDVKVFAAFGPGTIRGLNRIFDRCLDSKAKLSIMKNEIRLLQGMSDFNLDAYDICNCLCEVDKYIRAVEGKTLKRRYGT